MERTKSIPAIVMMMSAIAGAVVATSFLVMVPQHDANASCKQKNGPGAILETCNTPISPSISVRCHTVATPSSINNDHCHQGK